MTQPSGENAILVVRRSDSRRKRLAILLGVIGIALPLILLARYGKSREAARRELDQKGISFTEDSFLQRIKQGDIATVKLFLSAGVNPDAKDENDDTALMNAIAVNSEPIAEALLKGSASVNARTKNGSTALHFVALRGDDPIGRLLLQFKADVNLKTDIGETPLMIAALRGFPETVKLLLASGADVNAKDNRGETPLMHAQERNHTEVVEVLKAASATQ